MFTADFQKQMLFPFKIFIVMKRIISQLVLLLLLPPLLLVLITNRLTH